MYNIDVMGYMPNEFYSLFGRKAELYSQMLRDGSVINSNTNGILFCDDTSMTDVDFRYKCIYLAQLWDESN